MRSQARVAFFPGEEQAARRISRRLFGRYLEAWQYAGLAGAPDGARVEIGDSGDALLLELDDPVAAVYRAVFTVRPAASGVVLWNEGLRIHHRAMRRRGLGTRIFRRQVVSAAALRVTRIVLTAGRNHDENGYYTWPRFGFDGPLPAGIRTALPAELHASRSVLDLFESEQGRRWWRDHGVELPVAFDLSPGSRSRQVFDRYLRSKFRSGLSEEFVTAGWPKKRD